MSCGADVVGIGIFVENVVGIHYFYLNTDQPKYDK